MDENDFGPQAEDVQSQERDEQTVDEESSEPAGESTEELSLDVVGARGFGAQYLVTESERGVDYYLEVAAAILLAFATVFSAWSAFEATQWSGIQSRELGEASTARIESSKEFNLALQLAAIDVNLFMDWANAISMGDTELQQFYEDNLFRPEFIPVLEDWIAQDPLNNPDAAKTPFDNDAYINDLFAQTTTLEDEASAQFANAEAANQNGDDYILNTVFFASVLLFAGVASKFRPVNARVGLLSLGALIFVLSLIRMLTLPIEFNVNTPAF